ncbi:MAG: hypothetical protein GY742_22330 [Hyphomicrobiales bacterium]|nr:hypothetical protein [Hyphomicrobiales bacterium]
MSKITAITLPDNSVVIPGSAFDELMSRSPACYLPGSMPEGWGLRRHVPGEIVVTHKDGSGVVIRDDAERVAETLFYRMMDQILLGK